MQHSSGSLRCTAGGLTEICDLEHSCCDGRYPEKGKIVARNSNQGRYVLIKQERLQTLLQRVLPFHASLNKITKSSE